MCQEQDYLQEVKGCVRVGNSVDKKLYKVTLELLKVIPMLLAFCDALHTLLDLCGVDAPVISFIGGISFLTLAFLYLVSYVFKFCIYHRMFLHYIVVNNIISTIEFTIGIPASFMGLCCVFSITLGVFAFLILYFYRKEKLCCK